MVNDVNRVFALAFIPLQGIFTGMTICGNLILIQHWGEMKLSSRLLLLTITSFAAFGWAIFLSLAGLIWLESGKTLKSWRVMSLVKDRQDIGYVKRIKLSCKPFVFGYGKFMNIKPKNFLQHLRRVSRGTLKALIGSRKVH